MERSVTTTAFHNVELGYEKGDPNRPFFVCHTCDEARVERPRGMSHADWERTRDSFAAEHPCQTSGKTA